jgi:hypothetical protein
VAKKSFAPPPARNDWDTLRPWGEVREAAITTEVVRRAGSALGEVKPESPLLGRKIATGKRQYAATFLPQCWEAFHPAGEFTVQVFREFCIQQAAGLRLDFESKNPHAVRRFLASKQAVGILSSRRPSRRPPAIYRLLDTASPATAEAAGRAAVYDPLPPKIVERFTAFARSHPGFTREQIAPELPWLTQFSLSNYLGMASRRGGFLVRLVSKPVNGRPQRFALAAGTANLTPEAA